MLVDCYADADFEGLWGHENPQDSIFLVVVMDLW